MTIRQLLFQKGNIVRKLDNRIPHHDMYYSMIAEQFPIYQPQDNEYQGLNSLYLKQGYVTQPIKELYIEPLMEFFSPALATPFEQEDFQPNYYSPRHSNRTMEWLNSQLTFFKPPIKGPGPAALLALLTEMSPLIEQSIGHAFEIVNVRAWVTHVNADQFGPNEWHVDGVSHFIRKVMIYPRPLGANTGTFEIIDPNGERILLESPVPLAVLADVGDLRHRGIPPNSADPLLGGRPAIEVTLIPSETTRLNVNFHGHNAHVPKVSMHQWGQLFEASTSKNKGPNIIQPTERFINIGGGLNFSHEGWINFDVASPNYLHRIDFDANTYFPYPTGGAKIVYSSHCFEHLDDSTVIQLFQEAKRILSGNGHLVIKLPDFDALLAAWKQRDSTGILEPTQWNLRRIFTTWEQSGISTEIEACTAVIFCGFWNSAYGNPFLGSNVPRSGAYHGPPRISSEKLAEILDSTSSPKLISSILKSEIVRQEIDYTFNHQNAWSRNEFIELAHALGFEIVALDRAVRENFSDIPTIEEMNSMSAYYQFKKSA